MKFSGFMAEDRRVFELLSKQFQKSGFEKLKSWLGDDTWMAIDSNQETKVKQLVGCLNKKNIRKQGIGELALIWDFLAPGNRRKLKKQLGLRRFGSLFVKNTPSILCANYLRSLQATIQGDAFSLDMDMLAGLHRFAAALVDINPNIICRELEMIPESWRAVIMSAWIRLTDIEQIRTMAPILRDKILGE
jgi:hypothetical protein